MHRRTLATRITPKTRLEVEKRDGGLCIFCKRPGRGEAHVVRRSQGGMGCEENVVTICRDCHRLMDESEMRDTMEKIAEAYLRIHYPGWTRQRVIYNKWTSF